MVSACGPPYLPTEWCVVSCWILHKARIMMRPHMQPPSSTEETQQSACGSSLENPFMAAFIILFNWQSVSAWILEYCCVLTSSHMDECGSLSLSEFPFFFSHSSAICLSWPTVHTDYFLYYGEGEYRKKQESKIKIHEWVWEYGDVVVHGDSLCITLSFFSGVLPIFAKFWGLLSW